MKNGIFILAGGVVVLTFLIMFGLFSSDTELKYSELVVEVEPTVNVEDSDNVTTSMYNDRELVLNLNVLPSTETNNTKIKINTYDNTNEKNVQNVTYFLSISKNSEHLIAKYFFAGDSILIIDIQPNSDQLTKVIGEKQYAHDAYVMPGSEYMVDQRVGETLTSVTPIQIIGPIFNTDGIYIIDIQLRTIDSRDNWALVLLPHYQITVGKDGNWSGHAQI